MTLNKALYPRDVVDRLNESRKEGRGTLASIEYSVDASIQWLEDYLEEHEGGLITAMKNDIDNKVTKRMTITRKQKNEEKHMCGRFKRLINNFSYEKTWKLKEKQNLF